MAFKDDLLEICETAIKPACADCGFDAFLISDKPHNNNITDEIIAALRQSKFVVVDFTYNNPGAYFEAGFAQGLGCEVIRCCNKEWFENEDNQLHFDIRHYNTFNIRKRGKPKSNAEIKHPRKHKRSNFTR